MFQSGAGRAERGGMRRIPRRFLVGFVAIAGSTSAYTISTIFTPGCHERLATEALRAVRLELPQSAPISATNDERALIGDLEFTPAQDMKDLGAATLLVSVRDNDLKGRASDDLSLLAQVHGNPDNQDEHCLRSAAQDEPSGSQAAVDDCRNFIRGRVAEALDGLDANGAPDPAVRESLPLHLALRGNVDARLPTYYVRIGQAMHAVQDSFAHTYRTADGLKITVVLNWIDEENKTLVESRDGPAHLSALDVCDDSDELRTTRRTLASAASVALLRTTLDPQLTRAQKVVAVDGLLDTYLSYSPGCTFDNGWCGAPERQYQAAATAKGCSSAGGASALGLVAALVLGGISRARGLVLAGVLVVALRGAQAEEPSQPPAVSHSPPPPVTVPVPQPGPRDPSELAFGGYLGLSGAIDKPAVAVQVGLRLRVSTHWTFGWDAEWNPWLSLYGGPTTFQRGVINTYGTIILRFPLAYENFNLRTTLNLGFSYLMMDLYGAPKGSLGFYGAVSPLGLEWKVSRALLLIINPLSISVPVPQIRGVPLLYPQYRFSIGLGFLTG